LQLPPPAEPVKETKAEYTMAPLVIGTPSRTLMEIVGSEPAGPRSSNKSVLSMGGGVGPKPTYSTQSTRSTASKADRYMSEFHPMTVGNATKRLRDMACNNPSAAWKNLQSEFETQQLIWQSLSLTRGKDKTIQGKIDGLKANVERIFHTLHTEGRGDQALLTLEDLLERNVDMNVCTQSIRDTARDVIKQHRLAPSRNELAERVDVSSVPATLPKTDQDKKELEELVLACDLDDQVLDYSVRLSLLLAIPKEFQQKLGSQASMKKSTSQGSLVNGQKRSSMRSVGSKASRKDSAIGATASRKDSALRAGSGGVAFGGLGAIAVAGPRVVEAI